MIDLVMEYRTIIITIFALLALVWIFTNHYSIRERLNHLLRPAILITSLFPGLIVMTQILYPTFLHLPSGNMGGILSTCGLVIYTAGAAFAIWAKIAMGKSWSIPAQHDISKQDKLVTAGPFAFSRNPIYVGFLAMFVGFELALESFLVVLVVPLYFLIRHGVIIEEKFLEKHFGPKYFAYKAKTPRFI